MSCSNGVEPLLLPITNVTVSSDGRTNSRGIELIVGKPEQIVAVSPLFSDQDVAVVNAADCNGTSDYVCIGQYGGVFDPEVSDTYSRSTMARWNGSETLEDVGSFIYFNDYLGYGAEGESLGFPMYTNEPRNVHQGGLGLGANSTFLETAWESDQAPSKAVGMWIGSESQSDPHNGLVVIGGYDSSRIEGDFTEFEYENLCPACVHVESMTFDWEGDSTSLMDEDAGDMKVLLNPYWHDLLVGPSMFKRFMDVTNGTYTLGLGIHWRTEETPLGNITITLRGGYKTVIPPEVFFRFARGYREDGSFEILGDELLVASMSNFSDETLMPHWGIPFMTMNYLLIDHQNEEFKMAAARQGDIEQDPIIEPVCFSDSASGSSSNAGAIAGGLIGGLAGLVLLVFAIWWFWWRQRKGFRPTATEIPEGQALAPAPANSKDEKPQELSSATEKYELAPSSTFASEMATPDQMRFSPGYKSTMQELASLEQMNGAIYGQLAKRGTVDSAMTGVSSIDSANAKEMPAESSLPLSASKIQEEPVEMAADTEKSNRQ